MLDFNVDVDSFFVPLSMTTSTQLFSGVIYKSFVKEELIINIGEELFIIPRVNLPELNLNL
jgi:hypothetical protein